MTEISIYDFQTMSILDQCIKYKKIIFYFDFNCNNEMILFECVEKDIITYEIDDTHKNKLSEIKGH